MKKFKITAVIACVFALTAIPGFFNTLPQATDYQIDFALLVFGHALAGISIVIGTILTLQNKISVAKWLLICGCLFASYGKLVAGYHFQYPLFYSFKFSSFEGFNSFSDGYTLDLPFILLAGALIYLHQPAELESQNQSG